MAHLQGANRHSTSFCHCASRQLNLPPFERFETFAFLWSPVAKLFLESPPQRRSAKLPSSPSGEDAALPERCLLALHNHTVCAWRSCRQLQVVHLPDTVVSLLHGAFSRCRVLRAVTAPGCQHFGTKVFEECCSLTQIGVTQCPGNFLAPQAQLRPRVFQGCTALQHLDLAGQGQPRA